MDLDGSVLDRIDAIVAASTEIDPADNYIGSPPAITDKRLRRA